MPTPLEQRLSGIRSQLVGAYEGSSPSSSATKGREREFFVNLFLKNLFPPQFRFGTGEITDIEGTRTGQLDIVVELPFFASFPLVGAPDQRLYLVDGVSAVIEVKSDLSAEWEDVLRTARSLAGLKSSFLGEAFDSRFGPEFIAFFAVGFRGWKTADAVVKHRGPPVDAILQIDPPFFVCPAKGSYNENELFEGESALGAMVAVMNEHLLAWQSKRNSLLPYFDKHE